MSSNTIISNNHFDGPGRIIVSDISCEEYLSWYKQFSSDRDCAHQAREDKGAKNKEDAEKNKQDALENQINAERNQWGAERNQRDAEKNREDAQKNKQDEAKNQADARKNQQEVDHVNAVYLQDMARVNAAVARLREVMQHVAEGFSGVEKLIEEIKKKS